MDDDRKLSPGELLDFGKSVLAQQPFSVLVGTELTAFEPGRAELTLRVREPLLQQHGFVHGGVLSYLADNAVTFAAGSLLGDSLTVELKINYVRPARGESLIARAKVEHRGRRQAVARCELYALADGGEKLCALAQGTVTQAERRQDAARGGL
jgi:uncharacterized protein (TIGR00369 family)